MARNAGFAAAQGDILAPLDADDLLPPEALSHIGQAFAQHPDAGFIYGSYVCQRRPGDTRVVKAAPISLNSLLRSRRFSLSTNWTLIGTAPLRKSLWEAVGHKWMNHPQEIRQYRSALLRYWREATFNSPPG